MEKLTRLFGRSIRFLPEVAEKLQAVNDRFAGAQAENLNVESEPLNSEHLQRRHPTELS